MPEKSNKRRRGRKSDGVLPEDSIETYQPHKSPLIQLDEDAPTWFDYGKSLSGRNDTTASEPPGPLDQPNNKFVAKFRSIGDMIFQQEMQLIGKGSTADERWVESTMRKGTLKDRIAAMSVTVSSDPIHKFYALDGLLSMVGCSESGGKTNSRVAQLTAEALDDLFLNTFLPPDRKLLSLSQRPLYRYETDKNGKKSKKTLSPRILLLWRFEEMVKEKYELYIRKYMVQTLQDGAEMQKTAILQSAGLLLSSVPEGESTLLTMMVNKLGDPAKKVASAAGHQLRQVLQKHPNMQLIVAREVQQLAHRPHLSARGLYTCIVFLNQLKLVREEEIKDDATKELQMESLPASLIKTYFRLFEVAVKKKNGKNSESEGAYMKSRLLCALLTGVNRAHPYLPEDQKDMNEHIDALYRVVHTAAPTACTQALMLLFHLAIGIPDEKEAIPDEKLEGKADDVSERRKDRFYSALYATLSKPDLVSQGKHLTMYFNLLYKAMKHDTDSNRVNAFAKRLMCTVLHCNSPPVAGSIFLLNEIAKTHDGLRICMEDPPTESDALVYLNETKRDPRSALSMKTDEHIVKKNFFPPCWELSLVAHHFHPSVSRFANSIGSIDYTGDPLKDFALAPFLDKFAYRNPKSQSKLSGQIKRGESIAERRSGTDKLMQSRLEVPMNDPAFLEKEDINEQDEFFHRFFVERARRDQLKGITRGDNSEMNEEDQENAEDGAMDVAEESEGLDAGKSFEEYERAWDSDPEEEAFVDSLAVKLMEDAADGPVDIDDDPDMDDWGDMFPDETDNMESFIDHKELDGTAEDSDGVDDLESEYSSSHVPKGAGNDDDDFMDESGNDDDDSSEAGDEFADERTIQQRILVQDDNTNSDDASDDAMLAFAGDVSDDSSNESEENHRKKRKTNLDSLPVFADAEDYAEMIETDFHEVLSGASSKANKNQKVSKTSKKGRRHKSKP